MRHTDFIQCWFSLTDLSCQRALYDNASLRRCGGIDLDREAVADATTMRKFLWRPNDDKLQGLFARADGDCRAEAARLTLAPSQTQLLPPRWVLSRTRASRVSTRFAGLARAHSEPAEPEDDDRNIIDDELGGGVWLSRKLDVPLFELECSDSR